MVHRLTSIQTEQLEDLAYLMCPIPLLLETQEAAREVALMLRCEYDGCTMITLPPSYDSATVKLAIDLIGADFCFEGDRCLQRLPLSRNGNNRGSNEHKTKRITLKSKSGYDQAPF